MRVTGGAPSKVAALLTSRHYGACMHLLLTRRPTSSAAVGTECVGAGEAGEVEGGVEGDVKEGAVSPVLLAARVWCCEQVQSKGGEGGGELSFKAVKGLFKGFFT